MENIHSYKKNRQKNHFDKWIIVTYLMQSRILQPYFLNSIILLQLSVHFYLKIQNYSICIENYHFYTPYSYVCFHFKFGKIFSLTDKYFWHPLKPPFSAISKGFSKDEYIWKEGSLGTGTWLELSFESSRECLGCAGNFLLQIEGFRIRQNSCSPSVQC